MADNTTPAVVAASKSSLDVMLDTINSAATILQNEMPVIAEVGGFVPGATVYIQLAAMALPMVQNAIKWVEKEEGKSPLEAFQDIIKTLAPGNGFVAPALAKSSP